MEVRTQCEVCKELFTSHQTLNLHFRSVHMRPRHYCDFCSKSYARNEDRLRHMRSVHRPSSSPLTTERRYCDFCPKSYCRNKDRLRHMRTAHNASPLTPGKRSPKPQISFPNARRSIDFNEETQKFNNDKTPEIHHKYMKGDSNPEPTDKILTPPTPNSSCKRTACTSSTTPNKGDFCIPKSTLPQYRSGHGNKPKTPMQLADRASEQAMFHDLEKQFNRCVMTAERLIADIRRKKKQPTPS